MTNEQMAARLEEIARDQESMSNIGSDAESLRAGAKALRTLDEIHAAAEKHAGHEIGLWPMAAKVTAHQLDASQREVERLRGALRSINRMDENGNAVLKGWSEIDDIIRAALSGIATPDPRDARIAELEAALRVAINYVPAEVIDWGAVAAGIGVDNIRTPNPDHATVDAALKEASDE